jgi:hypothetical protein
VLPSVTGKAKKEELLPLLPLLPMNEWCEVKVMLEEPLNRRKPYPAAWESLWCDKPHERTPVPGIQRKRTHGRANAIAGPS